MNPQITNPDPTGLAGFPVHAENSFSDYAIFLKNRKKKIFDFAPLKYDRFLNVCT